MTDLRKIENVMASDMEAQSKFLLTEALWRGYSSVEELLRKEPSTFDHLAAHWREVRGEVWDGLIG
jgi:hypothetical protein